MLGVLCLAFVIVYVFACLHLLLRQVDMTDSIDQRATGSRRRNVTT